MPKRRGMPGEPFNRMDISAIPDIAEVWHITNEKFERNV